MSRPSFAREFLRRQGINQKTVRHQRGLEGHGGKRRTQLSLTVRPAKAIAGEHPVDSLKLGGQPHQKAQGFTDGSYDVVVPQIVSRNIGFAQKHKALQGRVPTHTLISESETKAAHYSATERSHRCCPGFIRGLPSPDPGGAIRRLLTRSTTRRPCDEPRRALPHAEAVVCAVRRGNSCKNLWAALGGCRGIAARNDDTRATCARNRG